MIGKALADTVTVAAAVSSPWWISLFGDAYTVLLAVGTLVALYLRVAVAWREWREVRKSKD